MKEPELQMLRIPSGWNIEFNDLLEIDVSNENYRKGYLKEDMLQMKHNNTHVLVDVGWYGGAPSEGGGYGVTVHKNDFNGPLLEEHHVVDKPSMLSLIEGILFKYTKING